MREQGVAGTTKAGRITSRSASAFQVSSSTRTGQSPSKHVMLRAWLAPVVSTTKTGFAKQDHENVPQKRRLRTH